MSYLSLFKRVKSRFMLVSRCASCCRRTLLANADLDASCQSFDQMLRDALEGKTPAEEDHFGGFYRTYALETLGRRSTSMARRRFPFIPWAFSIT